MHLGGRVLIAIDPGERILCCLDHKCRRVIATADTHGSVSAAVVAAAAGTTDKNPWPKLMTGFSDAATASLTVDLREWVNKKRHLNSDRQVLPYVLPLTGDARSRLDEVVVVGGSGRHCMAGVLLETDGMEKGTTEERGDSGAH